MLRLLRDQCFAWLDSGYMVRQSMVAFGRISYNIYVDGTLLCLAVVCLTLVLPEKLLDLFPFSASWFDSGFMCGVSLQRRVGFHAFLPA